MSGVMISNPMPTPTQIRYTALFVDNPEELLKLFPPKHPKVFAHHSTNQYKPSNIENLEIGKKSVLKIIGQASDNKCYALLVENPKSENKFPHITISCSEDTSPVYSNQLLEKASSAGTIEIFPVPFFISVTEGYVDIDNNLTLENRL